MDNKEPHNNGGRTNKKNNFFLNNGKRPQKKKPVDTIIPKYQKIYAAIDLGTTSCRLVLANPTPTGSFKIVETFSKVTKLGEGIINNERLSNAAIKRTVNTLKVCSEVINEFSPIYKKRYVTTAACRRAKNCDYFTKNVIKNTGIDLEVISSQEEARLSVVGCMPLVNKHIKRALVFDIGGGSTELSWAKIDNDGKVDIIGAISLPYGVVTVSEAFPGKDMTKLAYDAVSDKTTAALADFEKEHNILEVMKNEPVQMIGTSGTVTVLGAIHLNLQKYNRSAVDGLVMSIDDINKVIGRIKRLGVNGRKKHPCIGSSKADLTIAGSAIMEAICSFWPIGELTVADRGIREGIILDMIQKDIIEEQKKPDNRNKKYRGKKNKHKKNYYNKYKKEGK